METRIQHIFLKLRAALAVSGLSLLVMLPLSAQQVDAEPQDTDSQKSETELVEDEVQQWDEASVIVEPEIKRKKIELSEIDAEDIEIGIFVGQMSVEDFGTNILTGASIAYHVTEDIFVAASFGATDTDQTSFEVISGARLLTDDERALKYYDLSVGLNVLPGEGFIGSSYAFNSTFYGLLGIGSTEFAGDQRFTVTGGAGYKVIMQDWLAIHIEVKDHLFDIDILGTNKSTHNIIYDVGFTFFF